MDRPEISRSPEQNSSENPELQLALKGLRSTYDGFTDSSQQRLAWLMDSHDRIDHSIDVIRLDAQVKLTGRRKSPTVHDNTPRRTPQEEADLAELEKENPKKPEGEETRTDREINKENEIRQRKITIRKVRDQSVGKGYEEAKAYIAGLHQKHHTTHRPTSSLEKAAAKRHTNLLDGSFHRTDRLTQALGDYEASHGDDKLSVHPADFKNRKRQQKIAKRAQSAKEFAEDQVWKSIWREGPEQKRLKWKQARTAEKITKLSKKVREKGLWIDDLFELNPVAPSLPVEASPTIADKKYEGRPFPAMTINEFSAAKNELPSNRSRTEQALSVVLGKLSEADESTVIDLDYISELIKDIDGATPALAKFTLQKLLKDRVTDKSGNIIMKATDLSKLEEENTKVSVGSQAQENSEKATDRLKSIKNQSDKLYAFALGHISGFYSPDNKFKTLPRLSIESLNHNLKNSLRSDDITDAQISSTYDRLISQGIISADGTVRQPKEVLRGALGALYGDDLPLKKKEGKRER